MIKEFVTYEQALTLKELGYREECAAHYPFDEELHLKWRYYGNMSTHPLNTLQAPTKSQVFRWFREKYELRISNYRCSIKKEGGIVIGDGFRIFKYGKDTISTIEKETYEEAENACIDKLISICKQQDNGTSN